jgi:pilus assembly protein CpaB
VNTVTIAVTPEDAEKLALASNDGKIQLVLRNFSDAAKVETPGSDKGGLIGSMHRSTRAAAKRTKSGKKAAAVQVADSSYMVEVIRGGKRSEERVD